MEMKLNVLSFSLASGILRGLGVFIFGIWALYYGPSEMLVHFFGKYYYGYNPGIIGALIGLVWGFADAFIGGFIFSLIYNFFLPKKKDK